MKKKALPATTKRTPAPVARRRLTRTAILAALLVLLALPALPAATLRAAVTPPPSPPPGLHTWSTSGPLKAYAYHLAIAPSNPDLLFAASQGGVVKSTNGGDRWTLTALATPVSTIAVDPLNPDIVIARDFIQAFKTTDGGDSWRTIPHSDRFYRLLAVNLTSPPAYYSLHYNENRLYKSTDDGATWARIGAGLPATSMGLALTPGRPNSLYAVPFTNNQAARGLYHSTDGGTNWSRISADPFQDGYSDSVVVAAADPGVLYANSYRGLSRSTNGGLTWSDLRLPTGSIFLDAIDPTDASTLYARTNDGLGRVLKSRDGGASWSDANAGLDRFAFVYALALNPRRPATLYAGTRAGIYRSDDGATSWQEIQAAGLSASISSLLAGPEGVLLAEDRFKSTDRGASWQRANLPGPAYLLTADPGNANHFYAIADTNDFVYKSTDGGASWSATPMDPAGASLNTLAIVPGNPSLLFASAGLRDTGENVFLKSTDGGATWQRLGNIVPGPYLLVADPSNAGLLYAGVDIGYDCDGLCDVIIKSTDGGVSWKQAGRGQLNNYYLSALALDPGDPATLYAGLTDGRLFKSTDGGASWVVITPFSAVPESYHPIRLVLEPTDSQTLYVGYRNRVYTSRDGGGSWREVKPALPADLLIQSLAIDPSGSSLHVGTPRGVFDYHFASPCAAPLTPATQAFAAEGGAGSVAVTAVSDCAWMAESDAGWLQVTSAASGAGNATISYTVAPNDGTAARTGRIGIGGRTFKVTQAGLPVRISGATVAGKKLFVAGENFDPGAVLLLNGEEQLTKNDLQNPKGTLIGKRAGKKVKAGDRLRVRNPNGSLSEEFTFPGQ